MATPKPLKSIEVQLAEAVARAEKAIEGGAVITFTGEMKATGEKFWACTSKTTPGLAYTIKSDGHRCYCTCQGADDPRFICWHRGAAYVQQVYAGIGKLAAETDAYFNHIIAEAERKENAASVESQDEYEESIAPEHQPWELYSSEYDGYDFSGAALGVTAGDIADAMSETRESGLEWDAGSDGFRFFKCASSREYGK